MKKEATIGANALLGARVTVEEGVQIGKWVVIGQDTKIEANAMLGRAYVPFDSTFTMAKPSRD